MSRKLEYIYIYIDLSENRVSPNLMLHHHFHHECYHNMGYAPFLDKCTVQTYPNIYQHSQTVRACHITLSWLLQMKRRHAGCIHWTHYGAFYKYTRIINSASDVYTGVSCDTHTCTSDSVYMYVYIYIHIYIYDDDDDDDDDDDMYICDDIWC